MNEFIKKIAKLFIILSQKQQSDIRQSVLLVDGSFILPNNFILILTGVKEKFKNTKIKVLTFEDKKEFLQESFPDIEVIIPDPKIRVKRLRFYIQLLKLLHNNFNFIVLTSLDIIPVAACLFLSSSVTFLHNKWLEWYQLRFRNVVDILQGTKSADRNRKKKNSGIKDILKSFGRNFVILQGIDKAKIKTNILITDNGYTPLDHITTAVRCLEETFINPNITILTFMGRKDNFNNIFPSLKIISAANLINSRRLAWQMYCLRKHRFDYIVLTTLDILPITSALGFSAAKVLLYNKWHQWWSLEFKSIKEYLKELIKLIMSIPVVIYLSIICGIILLRTFFRSRFINLKTIPSRK